MIFGSTSKSCIECGVSETLSELEILGDDHEMTGFASESMVKSLFVVFVCFRPGTEFKRYVKYDRLRRTLFIDVLLDYGAMVSAGRDGRKELVLACLADQVSDMVATLKIAGFDSASFTSAFNEWVERLRLNPSSTVRKISREPPANFALLVQEEFEPLASKLNMTKSDFYMPPPTECIAYAGDGKMIVVVAGLKLDTVHVSSIITKGKKPQSYWLVLHYEETYLDGTAAIRLIRIRKGMPVEDPVGYVKLDPAGDLREALRAFAKFISENPDVAFPGNPIKIVKPPSQ